MERERERKKEVFRLSDSVLYLLLLHQKQLPPSEVRSTKGTFNIHFRTNANKRKRKEAKKRNTERRGRRKKERKKGRKEKERKRGSKKKREWQRVQNIDSQTANAIIAAIVAARESEYDNNNTCQINR